MSQTQSPFTRAYTGGKQGSNRVTILETAAGQQQHRIGGSPAWRNNNPGNIRPSKYNREQIGEAWGFAVFPSYESGLRAMQNLLSRPLYANLSLEAAIFKYAPPSDNNPSSAYARYVSKHSGVPLTQVLGTTSPQQMEDIIKAMVAFEHTIPGIINNI